MDVAEFDKFADEYLAAHKENLAITGEGPDYFARAKVVELARRFRELGIAAPRSILDFGCGVGAATPHLKDAFPDAEITSLDVSPRSLQVAQSRWPGMADFRLYDGGDIPIAHASVDLVYSACVFHHIDEAEHVRIFRYMARILSPDGVLAVFEHNPFNPVTRHIVATCPFDENAVLIPAAKLAGRQRQAGFSLVGARYTGFFPGALKALRGLEPLLAPIPIGAQYYTLARH